MVHRRPVATWIALIALSTLTLGSLFVHARHEDELRTSRREVAALRAKASAPSEAAPVRLVVAAPPVAPSPPAVDLSQNTGAPREPRAPSERVGAAERVTAAVARVSATLEARLASEPADLHFGRDTRHLAASTLAEQAPGSHVDDMTCGSTLCRMTVLHDSPALARELASRISEHPPFANGTFYSERLADARGASTTVLFVFRAGHGPGEP